MIKNHPYKYTSDDVVFATSAPGRALGVEAKQAERQKAREQFFSRGQACLRASALGKKFGSEESSAFVNGVLDKVAHMDLPGATPKKS